MAHAPIRTLISTAAATALAATGLLTAGTVTGATTAHAATGTQLVMASPNTAAPTRYAVPAGTRLALTCYTRDQNVAGNPYWFRTADGGWVWSRSSSGVLQTVALPWCGIEHNLPFPGGARYYVTQSPYGSFSHNNRWNYHAIDLANGYSGGAVSASTGGTVVEAGWTDPRMANGIQVIVDYGGGRCHQYAHLSSESVTVGQKIARGTRIGTVGGTGYGRQGYWGPHLHFNTVACSDKQTSLTISETAERGTSYPQMWVVSQNR